MPRLANFNDPYINIPPMRTDWWATFEGLSLNNWSRDISSLQVDAERTKALSGIHQVVRCSNTSRKVPILSGVPLQLAHSRTTKVYEATVPPTLFNWFPSKQVPLPDLVYILSNTDEQWFGLDSVNGFYYECSSLGPTLFGWPAPWRADHIKVWDLKKDWRIQRAGITAAGIPLWPMIPKPEQLIFGRNLGHALHFCAAGYSPDKPVGIATIMNKTDGLIIGHPLRAGERLRLKWDRVPPVKNAAEKAIVDTLLTHGVILTDRTDHDPLGPGHSIRLPADSRISIDLDLRITDFEVILQP